MRLKEMTKPIFIVSLILLMVFEACDHDRPGPKPCGDGEIAAADATWSHGEGDLQNTQRASKLRIKGCYKGPALTPSLQWDVELSGPGTAAAPVIADDGTVYLMGEYPGQPKFGGLRDAGLFAINPDGSIKWYFSRPRQSSLIYQRSVALGNDGTVYFVMWDSTFYALDPNGNIKWSRRGIFTADPIIDNLGRIYTASDTVFCFNSDGSVAWTFSNDAPIEYGVRLVPGHTLIFCGFYLNGIVALDYNGHKKWFYQTRLDNIIHFTILVDQKDNTYFKCDNVTLRSVNSLGSLRWSLLATNTISEPVLRGNFLYFGNAFIYQVSLDSGEADSIAALDPTHFIDPWSSLLIDDAGTIYGSVGKYLYAFNNNHDRLWRLVLPELFPVSFRGYPALSREGRLYLTSYNYIDESQTNHLYAIE